MTLLAQHFRSRFALIGLALALGVLFISVRRLVLYGDFYDIAFAHPTNGLDWVIDFLTLCAYGACLLVAYKLLSMRRQTDASLAEFCLIMLLGLGGQVGTLGVVFGGWQLGLSMFALSGISSVVVASVIWLGGTMIVYCGKKLDKLIQLSCHRKG